MSARGKLAVSVIGEFAGGYPARCYGAGYFAGIVTVMLTPRCLAFYVDFS